MKTTTKNRLIIPSLFMFAVFLSATNLFGQSSDPIPVEQSSDPILIEQSNSVLQEPVLQEQSYGHDAPEHDIMDTSRFSLLDYRRMMKNGTTPEPYELVGNWRGVNKGIVERVGYKQFVKEFTLLEDRVVGDNIQVHQVAPNQIRLSGWEPKIDPATGEFERKGKFAVQPPSYRGKRGNSAIFSYRAGGNPRRDPARLLVDKVVKLDDDHLLGRATAKFGPVQIPLAYFVLERDYSTTQPIQTVRN